MSVSSTPGRQQPYVAMWPSGKFVAIDDTSGGYPCESSSFDGAATWPTAQAAADYLKFSNGVHPQGITIHKIKSINTAPVTTTTTTVTAVSFADPH